MPLLMRLVMNGKNEDCLLVVRQVKLQILLRCGSLRGRLLYKMCLVLEEIFQKSLTLRNSRRFRRLSSSHPQSFLSIDLMAW